MYDDTVPPPSLSSSNNDHHPLSPQIVSKRSLSSSSFKTSSSSTPPPSPPITESSSDYYYSVATSTAEGAAKEEEEDRQCISECSIGASSSSTTTPTETENKAAIPSTLPLPTTPAQGPIFSTEEEEEGRDIPEAEVVSPTPAEVDSDEEEFTMSSSMRREDNHFREDGGGNHDTTTATTTTTTKTSLSVTIPPPATPMEAMECGPFSPDTPGFSEFLSFLKTKPGPTTPNDSDFLSFLKTKEPTTSSNDDGGGASATTDVSSSTSPDGSPTISDNVKIPAVATPTGPKSSGDDGGASKSSSDAEVAARDAQQPFLHYPRNPPHPPHYTYSERYPPQMADYTSSLNAKTRIGKRCYRLNLERPFDIHCEQSPLEYGDYMAPWTKEVYPPTVGPTEYCPPRHLGGEKVVWRELMRWSNGAAAEEDSDERKVNSLDELAEWERGQGEGMVEREDSGGSMSSLKRAISDAADEEKRGSVDEIEIIEESSSSPPPPPTAINNGAGDDDDPAGEGWRQLSPGELLAAHKLGECNEGGELLFNTYDLSHVALNTANDKLSAALSVDNASDIMRDNTAPGGGEQRLIRTVFSMDSTTSEDERLNPKSPEDIANMTARLFRRSEFSLKESAEKDRIAQINKEAEERREEIERQERERQTGQLSDDSPLDMSTRTRKAKGQRRKLSSGGKRLVRRISQTFSNMQGTPSMDASWRGSSSHRARAGSAGSGRGRAGSGSERNAGLSKRSSMQALTIDKARDLVDESDGESGDGLDMGGDDGDDISKKPINVSLYILGEFDILNDLCNDGAKRLRENKESTDVDVLLQNDPCPPPNRWVRSTGWGKCNPSSNYAKIPPPDFDWERYYDKLRVKATKAEDGGGEGAGGVVKEEGEADLPQDRQRKTKVHQNPKYATTTQKTESTAAVSTSFSIEVDTVTEVTKPPPPMPSIPGSPAVPRVKTAPTDPSTPRGGGGGGWMPPQRQPPTMTEGRASGAASGPRKTSDFLSASARVPRAGGGGAKSHFNNNSISASERVPRTKRAVRTGSGSGGGAGAPSPNNLSASERPARTSSGGSSKSRGFGRRLTSMLRGKSSGSGKE